MLTVRDGIVATTVSLREGSDKAVRQAGAPAHESVLLFGSSDLLIINRGLDFDGEATPLSSVARTANWYYALALESLHDDARPRPFRGLAFFRLHRPQFDLPSIGRLTAILKQFRGICRAGDVAAEALLGYGWADLYLDVRAENLQSLLAAVAACRAIELEEHPVFRNSFTIVGVDLRFLDHAKVSMEPIMPTVALRVSPIDLSHIVTTTLRELFPDEKTWKTEITTGKRDVVVTATESIPFADFWIIHERVRNLIGADDSPVYKVETHLQFTPDAILPQNPPAAPPQRCRCAENGLALHELFKESLRRVESPIGQGLRQSFSGLANLYRETLEDRDNCCDFDAAAAHFYEQRKVFDHYGRIAQHVQQVRRVYKSEEIRARRRWELYREAFERLDISSMVIFQQEQNGGYADLLTRSERVSLFRGGMQKINTVLLATIDSLREQHNLPILPILCWWPAGQIQSERPIGVIKVPVFYLFQPEIALFLIAHELGQLSAYEYLRTRPEDDLSLDDEPVYRATPGGIREMKELLLIRNDAPTTVPERYLSELEKRGVDMGKLITDMFADLFLLRVGFGNDMDAMRMFLFEQFIRSEHALEPESQRGKWYCVQLVARFIAMAAACERLRHKPASTTPFEAREIIDATDEAITFLHRAVRSDRYSEQLDKQGLLRTVMTNQTTIARALDVFEQVKHWIRIAVEFAQRFSYEIAEGTLTGAEAVMRGEIVPIDPARIPAYFRELLDIEEDKTNGLLRVRAALTASVLTSCEPQRRLARADQAARSQPT